LKVISINDIHIKLFQKWGFDFMSKRLIGKHLLSTMIGLILVFILAGCNGGVEKVGAEPEKEGSGKKENSFSLLTYNVGTGAYVEAGILANKFREDGVQMRILPADTDMERQAGVNEGRADFQSSGAGLVFAQEGLYDFASPEWGPQNNHVIWVNNDENFALTLLTAADANIKTPYDLKGKRVGYIVGNVGTNINTEAFLAFGGLTWDDVTKVELTSLQAGFDAIIAGQVDAVHGGNVTSTNQQVHASPRGLNYMSFPEDDKEGWDRLLKIAPWFTPEKITTDTAGILSEENSVTMASYPYPIYVTSPDMDKSKVYDFAKLLYEKYDDYKGDSSSMSGYGLENQPLPWIFPIHEGTVELLKEIGAWTPDMEEKNNYLLKRNEDMISAFNKILKENPGLKGQELHDKWVEVREEQGFDFATLINRVSN
jgi:TRAP transporter TAXI family solute receptor